MAKGQKITADQLAKRLVKLPASMHKQAGKALYAFAKGVIVPAAKDNAPMMDGILRGTIDALPPVVEGKNVVVRVVAGGPDAPYAIAIHEHLSEHSPPTWVAAEESGKGVRFQVGGPKFMERALNDNQSKIPGHISGNVDIKNVWEET